MPNSSTKVPNALPDATVARTVLDALQALQADALSLELAKLRDGDGSKPSGHYDADGAAISYDDRAKQLAQAQQALSEQYKDHLPEIEKLIQERSGE